LTGNVVDDGTNPDSIYTKEPVTFAITGGDVDIAIPQSETYQIPYRFTFTKTGADDPLLDFYAVAPNVGTVQFPSLVPTGLSNVSLDTGALRVARLLSLDSQLSQNLKQSLIYSHTFDAETDEVKVFVPKPFSGGTLIRTFNVFGVSGYENWTFTCGVVSSLGVDSELTPASTTTVNQNGRRVIKYTHNSTQDGSILGLFIRAVPGVGATALNGTMSIAFIEV
jgi:hypothetical protein